MKTSPYFYLQPNSLFYRTAIEAKILFAVCLSKKQALTGGKSLAREDKCSKKIVAESAVLTLVCFYIIMIVHECQQSAKRKLLLNKNNLSEVFPLTIGSGKTMAFENRRGKYKELGKKVPQAYRVYVEDTFLPCDAVIARIFSKEGNMTNKLSTTNIPGSQGNSYPKAELDYNLDYEYDPAYAHRLIRAGTRYYRYDANGNITAEKDGPFTDEEEFTFTYSYDPETDVYGADYGFGLDAPKETEQANPQDLFAYRRNYTWNERNLLTKSSDRNFTVHYRYGEDGQRALKYTDEGRSETLYFNNFFTIHIPTQDQNNPQGLRVHKHIFVGNSRLVTAMTHTDNSGDNEEQKAKRYYYHSDHLGSAQFVTDWKGRQYEHIEYTPYGELWIEEVAAGLDKLPFRFTGKELDEETGLYYYGARYLDPKYSRWLSGDPALNDYIPKAPIDDDAKKHNENLPGMGGVFNTVNLHVYHYAGNNPIKYTDPDGRNMEDDLAKSLGSTSKKQGVDLNLFTANPKQDLYDEDEPEFGNMRQAASRAYKYAAFFYVAAHGNRVNASSCGEDGSLNYENRVFLSPKYLAKMIKSNPNYNGQPVVLWICNSGQDPQNIDNSQDCFAKKLADALGEGAIVIASTGFVNFKSGIFIQSKTSGNRKTRIPYTSVDSGEQYKFIGGK